MRLALALAATLALAACQNPNGSTNWGNTLLGGAAVGAIGAGAVGLMNDVGNSQRAQDPYGYGRPPGRRRGW